MTAAASEMTTQPPPSYECTLCRKTHRLSQQSRIAGTDKYSLHFSWRKEQVSVSAGAYDDPTACPECGAEDEEYGQHEPGCPSGYPTRDPEGEALQDATREYEDLAL